MVWRMMSVVRVPPGLHDVRVVMVIIRTNEVKWGPCEGRRWWRDRGCEARQGWRG